VVLLNQGDVVDDCVADCARWTTRHPQLSVASTLVKMGVGRCFVGVVWVVGEDWFALAVVGLAEGCVPGELSWFGLVECPAALV